MPYETLVRIQTGIRPKDARELQNLADKRQCTIADVARQCIHEGLKIVVGEKHG